MPQSDERYLRMKEVSEKTGVPVGTLQWWRKLALAEKPEYVGPPSAMFGGRVVYRESDVDAWIAVQFAKAGAR